MTAHLLALLLAAPGLGAGHASAQDPRFPSQVVVSGTVARAVVRCEGPWARTPGSFEDLPVLGQDLGKPGAQRSVAIRIDRPVLAVRIERGGHVVRGRGSADGRVWTVAVPSGEAGDRLTIDMEPLATDSGSMRWAVVVPSASAA